MSVDKTISIVSTTSRGSSVIEESYTVVRSLGSGEFGQVKEVKKKTGGGKRFAWKQVSLEKDPYCENEVHLLGQLKHEGIVRIYDAYFRDGVVLDMVLELCPKGSMKEYIQSNYEMFPTSYPNKVYIRPDCIDIQSAMRQVLDAVKFLHANCVAHRDIKPGNVLLASGQRWKLADFNLSTNFQPGGYMVDHVGTRPFKAPEVPNKCYTEKCDIYSMGILFIALVTGRNYWRPEDRPESASGDGWLMAQAEILDEKVSWHGRELCQVSDPSIHRTDPSGVPPRGDPRARTPRGSAPKH
ncbi:unnamed protein product [Durusdinium trenchii]|uniref:Protein kinase domain-containing protein n=1 Tax=Durusdinium trenchii TaxID=1381693 RepID=A0ABP0MC02_9DINO